MGAKGVRDERSERRESLPDSVSLLGTQTWSCTSFLVLFRKRPSWRDGLRWSGTRPLACRTARTRACNRHLVDAMGSRYWSTVAAYDMKVAYVQETNPKRVSKKRMTSQESQLPRLEGFALIGQSVMKIRHGTQRGNATKRSTRKKRFGQTCTKRSFSNATLRSKKRTHPSPNRP